jgi:hypothetical protein
MSFPGVDDALSVLSEQVRKRITNLVCEAFELSQESIRQYEQAEAFAGVKGISRQPSLDFRRRQSPDRHRVGK